MFRHNHNLFPCCCAVFSQNISIFVAFSWERKNRCLQEDEHKYGELNSSHSIWKDIPFHCTSKNQSGRNTVYICAFVSLLPAAVSNLCQQTRCTRIFKSPGYHGNIVTYPWGNACFTSGSFQSPFKTTRRNTGFSTHDHASRKEERNGFQNTANVYRFYKKVTSRARLQLVLYELPNPATLAIKGSELFLSLVTSALILQSLKPTANPSLLPSQNNMPLLPHLYPVDCQREQLRERQKRSST